MAWNVGIYLLTALYLSFPHIDPGEGILQLEIMLRPFSEKFALNFEALKLLKLFLIQAFVRIDGINSRFGCR